jgi:hypothetical protein
MTATTRLRFVTKVILPVVATPSMTAAVFWFRHRIETTSNGTSAGDAGSGIAGSNSGVPTIYVQPLSLTTVTRLYGHRDQ